MSQTHLVRFYPVGNGDTSQIIAIDGKRYLFDYCHRKQDKDDKRIDLYNRLNEELEADRRNYFDVVAFTHADLDHIAGSTEFFHLNHSGSYQGGQRKIISELWVPAAMLLEPVGKDEQSDEFAVWRKEARHRLLDGKGIRVFSQPKPLMDWLEPKLKERGESPRARDHLFVDAGTLVPGYTLQNEGIEFFCHSPFIEHCEDGDIVRNDAALILNIRMRVAGMDTDLFQVGDSTWEVLDDLVRITKYHGNDDRLRWDLFNIPHHCSYRALGKEKGDVRTEPEPRIKELLEAGQPGSYMISSSDPILDTKEAYEQALPPHAQARNTYVEYLAKIRGRKLLVTMSEPSGYNPQPIEFAVGAGGVSKLVAAATGAAMAAVSSPSRNGFSTPAPRLG